MPKAPTLHGEKSFDVTAARVAPGVQEVGAEYGASFDKKNMSTIEQLALKRVETIEEISKKS